MRFFSFTGKRSRCLPKLFWTSLFFARLPIFEMMQKAVSKLLILRKTLSFSGSRCILASLYFFPVFPRTPVVPVMILLQ